MYVHIYNRRPKVYLHINTPRNNIVTRCGVNRVITVPILASMPNPKISMYLFKKINMLLRSIKIH